MIDAGMQTASVRLEFLDAQPQQPDPAETSAVARTVIGFLRASGYQVAPGYTGAMGGDVYELIQQAAQAVTSNKDMIIALIGLATPITTFLLGRHQQGEPAPSVELELELEGATVVLPVDHGLSDEQVLAELLDVDPQLLAKVKPQSQPIVRVRVPARSPR